MKLRMMPSAKQVPKPIARCFQESVVASSTDRSSCCGSVSGSGSWPVTAAFILSHMDGILAGRCGPPGDGAARAPLLEPGEAARRGAGRAVTGV
jgi:hypothetical protein